MTEPRFDAPRGFRPDGPRINPLAIDVPEIIEWIERKQPRAIGSWNGLGAEEYARSFAAARTFKADIIRDLHEGLVSSMRQGGDDSDFAKRMLPVLRQKGWLPELDDTALGRRLMLIYDTNLRTSQAVGKWHSFQRTKRLLPYLRYSAVMDRRTRPSHGVLHNIVLPVDHPFWQSAFPPCGFGCRCVITALSRSQAARRGVSSNEDASSALDAARSLSRGEGDFWDRNMALVADEAALAQVHRVNQRRLPGSAPVSGAMKAGRTAWAALFGQLVGDLIQRLLVEGEK